MSKMSAWAVTAVRRQLSVFTQPRWHTVGDHPVSTVELLSGAEFMGGGALDDLEIFLRPLLASDSKHRFPTAVAKALKATLAKPRISTLRALESACLTVIEKAEAGSSPVLAETLAVIRDVHERCAVYGAALGCDQACGRCAVLCARYWKQRPMNSHVDVISYGLMRSMIDFLSMADTVAHDDGESYIPESRHIQVEMNAASVRGLLHVLGVVQEAIVAGEISAGDALDQDMADIDAALVAEDRAGVKRRPIEKAPARPDPVDGGLDLDGWLPASVPSVTIVRNPGSVAGTKKGDHDPLKEAAAIVDKRIPLVAPPPDLTIARAELLGEFPHISRIIDRLLRPLAGQDVIHLPHVILWGPPGCAKTRFARRFGEVLHLQPGMFSLGGSTDSVTLAGTSRGWSTAMFCAPFRELLRTKIGNPLLIGDEVDKIGTSRTNGNASDVLIQMTGEESAARYRDPYLQAECDFSHINWIFTANSLDTVSRPLLDRCLVLRVDEPGPEHLRPLASSIFEDVRADRGLDELWAPPMDGVEWAALEQAWPGGSLRGLRRLIECVLDARDGGLAQ